MYKRLYEEEHKLHSSFPHSAEAAPGSPFPLPIWILSIDEMNRTVYIVVKQLVG